MSGRTYTASDVAIVIVTWNGRDELHECLDSLRAQTAQGFEIIVVDNASTDGTLELLKRSYPEVKVVRNGTNEGFAGGANAGVSATSKRLVITLNNDARADPDFVRALINRASTVPENVAMFQAKIRFLNDPKRLNSTGIILADNGHARDRDYDVDDTQEQAQKSVFCPTAGAAMYRRDMLEKVRLTTGVFDSSYFMYFEDVDLGWRCRLAGYLAEFVADAIVYHGFQASSRKLGSTFVPRQCKRNRLRTLLKNASWSYFFKVLPTTISDLWWLVRHTSLKEQSRVTSELIRLLRARRDVTTMTLNPRTDLEKRWSGTHS